MDWLRGGGEMGALIRAIDWEKTPLGGVDTWPQSLRTTVSLCLSSTLPILIAWGPERVQIYNDSYRPICGEKHPATMGQRFNDCWASALPAVGHVVDRAQGGEGSYIENLRMFLDRYGYLEEAWMTFSFSPIADESGGVGVSEGWPLLHATRSGAIIEVSDVQARYPGLMCGPYEDGPSTALLIPLQPSGTSTSAGCLVAGVSVKRALDAGYRGFFELLGVTITTAVSNVLAYEHEQKRAEALAQIDRAKTAFSPTSLTNFVRRSP